PADHPHCVGCATGGREAMIMSQRYPRYFDGLVAGAPAMRTGLSNLGMRSVSVALGAAALSDSDKRLVVDSMVAACDADDGVEDGMLLDPQRCDFSPRSLVCSGAKNDSCLTDAQAAGIERALTGPRNASGMQVYPGYLWDTGIAANGQGVIPGILHGAASPVGPRTPP